MVTERELVRERVAALAREADSAGLDAQMVARALVEQGIELWKAHRSIDDISSELRFIADSLDPDADFEFMRP